MKLFLIRKKCVYCVLIGALIFIVMFFGAINISNSIVIELYANSYVSSEFDKNISDICKNDEKIAYLTFDDGPTIQVTPKILDILKEENVKASFFVIGKNVDEHPEIVKRAYDEGHFIANHRV